MTILEAIEIIQEENAWREKEIKKWIAIGSGSPSGLVVKEQAIYNFRGFAVRGENVIKALEKHEKKIKANEMAIETLTLQRWVSGRD